jgi:hypothetical protein
MSYNIFLLAKYLNKLLFFVDPFSISYLQIRNNDSTKKLKILSKRNKIFINSICFKHIIYI